MHAPGVHRLHTAFEQLLAPSDLLALALSRCTVHAGAAGKRTTRPGVPGQTVAGSAAGGDGDEQAAVFTSLQQCPMLWLAYVRWLVACERVGEARRVLLRALTVCPWSKGLWLQGLGAVADAVQGREAMDLVEAMAARGLQVDTLPAEVLMEVLEQQMDEAE